MGNKELKKLLRELKSCGWEIKETKKGYLLFPPDKKAGAVAIHKTPSDRRAWANMLSELRRHGFSTG